MSISYAQECTMPSQLMGAAYRVDAALLRPPTLGITLACRGTRAPAAQKAAVAAVARAAVLFTAPAGGGPKRYIAP